MCCWLLVLCIVARAPAPACECCCREEGAAISTSNDGQCLFYCHNSSSLFPTFTFPLPSFHSPFPVLPTSLAFTLSLLPALSLPLCPPSFLSPAPSLSLFFMPLSLPSPSPLSTVSPPSVASPREGHCASLVALWGRGVVAAAGPGEGLRCPALQEAPRPEEGVEGGRAHGRHQTHVAGYRAHSQAREAEQVPAGEGGWGE